MGVDFFDLPVLTDDDPRAPLPHEFVREVKRILGSVAEMRSPVTERSTS